MIARRLFGRPRLEVTEDPERAAAFAAAAAFTPYLTTEIDGVFYLVSTADDGMAEDLFVRRLRPELVVLKRALQVLGPPHAGRTSFVDVGSNVGTTILPALRQGFTDGVACEPGPETARLLQANCAINGAAEAVQVVAAAVSDEEGTALLDVSGTKPGTFALARDEADSTVAVEVVTLDGLVARGAIEPERVGLLWIDAQGHEGRVLAGASKLLAARPPIVMALRRKKVEREEGELDRILELLRDGYARVVDLRVPNLLELRWKPRVRPIEQIAELVAERRTTDVLVLPR